MRFASSFLGSSAVAGRFDPCLLERRDADGNATGGGHARGGTRSAKPPALARRGEECSAISRSTSSRVRSCSRKACRSGIVSAIAGSVRCWSPSPERPDMPAPCRWRGATTPRPPPSSCSTSSSAARRLRHAGRHGRASLPFRTARSTSFRAAASCPSTSAPPTTPRAMPPSPTSWRRSRGSGDGAASKSKAKEVQRTAAVGCSPRLQSLLADAVTRADRAALSLERRRPRRHDVRRRLPTSPCCSCDAATAG